MHPKYFASYSSNAAFWASVKVVLPSPTTPLRKKFVRKDVEPADFPCTPACFPFGLFEADDGAFLAFSFLLARLVALRSWSLWSLFFAGVVGEFSLLF
jgi:hypothetical protein